MAASNHEANQVRNGPICRAERIATPGRIQYDMDVRRCVDVRYNRFGRPGSCGAPAEVAGGEADGGSVGGPQPGLQFAAAGGAAACLEDLRAHPQQPSDVGAPRSRSA